MTEPTAFQPTDARPPESESAPSVILVEDQADLRQVLESALELDGMRVASFASGADAIVAAKRLAPDVVVTDLLLPGASGFEIARQLRNEDGSRSVPIVLISDHLDSGTAAEVLRVFDAALPKPVDPFELVEAVRSVL